MPSPALTPAPLPTGWIYLGWTDPSYEIGVPATWQKSDPTATTDPAAMASMTPTERNTVQWFNDMATAGKIRLNSSGALPPSADPASDFGFVAVSVESGDASLAAFADREVQLDTDTFAARSIERSSVALPAGPAVRLAYTGQPGDASTKYAEIDYLFRLPDGRSMTVSIGAGTPATASDLATRVIATLRG